MLSRVCVSTASAVRAAVAPPAAARSMATISTDNPYTGEIHCETKLSNDAEALKIVSVAGEAQKTYYNETSLEDRIKLCGRFIEEFTKEKENIARDISCSMGKPFKQACGEVMGSFERVEAMMELAPAALAPVSLPEKGPVYHRSINKEPVGVVLLIAPWNYPLLTTVNCLIPAILAGNSVVIRHSERTPQVADHYVNAFRAAGFPESVVSSLHCSHDTVSTVIGDPNVGFVSFTGSVSGGRAVYNAVAAQRFIDCTLELGGKDPAYVAADANMDAAVDTVVDGAFYNAGQSCCGMERVYVHRSKYDEFLERAQKQIEPYVLGDPMADTTTLGPMAQANAPAFLHEQVKEAASKGARVLTGGAPTTDAAGKGRFFQPTLVADCNHTMSIMMEESFGPVLGVMPVDSDDEAIKLMNDSAYGLTAAIFTQDNDKAKYFAPRVQTGTFFQNRADYVDPRLAWTGVKNTGKGASLSQFGFNGVTKLKNHQFKQVS